MTSGKDDAKRSAPRGPVSVLRVGPLQDGSGFSLRGILDLSTAQAARDRLEPVWRPGTTVVLDLSELEFMDSTGLNLLCRGLVTLGERGSLVLRNPRGIVRRVLNVSGIEDRPNVRLDEA